MRVPFVNTFMGGDPSLIWTRTGRSPRDLAADRRAREGARRPAHHRELPDDLLLRRVAGRPQHRLHAVHLAPDPRDVGRHGRLELRPVAPRMADDRPGAIHPRVRAAHLHVQAKDVGSTATGCTSAASSPAASAGRSRGCPAWARRLGRIFAALWRAGYDGDVAIEHEDRDFEGTDELIKRGFLSPATSFARTSSEQHDHRNADLHRRDRHGAAAGKDDRSLAPQARAG